MNGYGQAEDLSRRMQVGSARTALLRLCGLLWLAGCTASDLPPLNPPAAGPYTLGTGDQIRLTVFGQSQLSTSYFVSPQGMISVPLIGDVPATGRTTAELGAEVADDLRSRRLVVDPSVSVDILVYRPVYVLGEVEKPGAYPYQPGLTTLSAVALAGGFTYRAVTTSGTVVRTLQGTAQRGRVNPDSFLEPGDVLTIPERFF